MKGGSLQLEEAKAGPAYSDVACHSNGLRLPVTALVQPAAWAESPSVAAPGLAPIAAEPSPRRTASEAALKQ